MEIAANVGALDETGRRSGAGSLTKLGRTKGNAQAREDFGLVRGVRQRLERLDVLRRPGRPDELGSEARGRRGHERDG